tara:strand:- start:20 stop:349 length:330 start_codon:yes stop_codon:yes gene_type:complete
MIFFPEDVWLIINSFLGVNYWYNRKKLTSLSNAIDFITSDYSNNSYWKWNNWRKNKLYLDTYIYKPLLPHRFINITNNPYILCVEPPKLTKSLDILSKLQKEYSDKIYK